MMENNKKGKGYFWIKIDLKTDETIAVADTQRELAEMLGVKKESIVQTISRAKRNGRPCGYMKIMEDDDEE